MDVAPKCATPPVRPWPWRSETLPPPCSDMVAPPKCALPQALPWPRSGAASELLTQALHQRRRRCPWRVRQAMAAVRLNIRAPHAPLSSSFLEQMTCREPFATCLPLVFLQLGDGREAHVVGSATRRPVTGPRRRWHRRGRPLGHSAGSSTPML
jgi:hypothetical protein